MVRAPDVRAVHATLERPVKSRTGNLPLQGYEMLVFIR